MIAWVPLHQVMLPKQEECIFFGWMMDAEQRLNPSIID